MCGAATTTAQVGCNCKVARTEPTAVDLVKIRARRAIDHGRPALPLSFTSEAGGVRPIMADRGWVDHLRATAIALATCSMNPRARSRNQQAFLRKFEAKLSALRMRRDVLVNLEEAAQWMHCLLAPDIPLRPSFPALLNASQLYSLKSSVGWPQNLKLIPDPTAPAHPLPSRRVLCLLSARGYVARVSTAHSGSPRSYSKDYRMAIGRPH
jgi:hypothetical protein